jgi:alpha-tubulin suppressor-like RCC1 family protein
LGDNGVSGSQASTPVTVETSLGVPLSGIRQIAGGDASTCAILTNGNLYCWGKNNTGQLGDTTTTLRGYAVPIVSVAANAIWISVNTISSCVLLSTGVVKCTGENRGYGTVGDLSYSDTSGVLKTVSGLSNIAALARSGFSYSNCALDNTGILKCWGRGFSGQIGDGGYNLRYSPTAVTGLANVTQISAGERGTCARLGDSTVKCWGSNRNNRLANSAADTIPTGTPANVQNNNAGAFSDFNDATQVASGTMNTCILTSTGTVQCWGYVVHGITGANDIVTARNSPTTGVTATGIAAGATSATSISITGNSNYQTACAVITGGTAKCWGYNSQNMVGDGTTTLRKTPVNVLTAAATNLTGVTKIASGGTYSCAIAAGGTVYCWGSNGSGATGQGTTVGSTAYATQVAGIANAFYISTGFSATTCAVIDDDTANDNIGSITCWGKNANGQVGDGTTTDQTSPVANIGGITNAIAVANAGSTTCAVLSTGSIKCWGDGDYGKCGDGNYTSGTNNLTPITVSGITNATAITAGDYHFCALLNDGTVSCWGMDNYGQLGIGNNVPITPVRATLYQ